MLASGEASPQCDRTRTSHHPSWRKRGLSRSLHDERGLSDDRTVSALAERRLVLVQRPGPPRRQLESIGRDRERGVLLPFGLHC
eukprot:802635-Prymnesium_polylepis.1